MLKAILVTLAVSLGVVGCAKKEEPAATNAPSAPPPTANQSSNPTPPQANPPQPTEPAKSSEESGKEHLKTARDKAKDTEKELAAGALDLLKAKVDEKIESNKEKGGGSSDKPKDPVKQ